MDEKEQTTLHIPAQQSGSCFTNKSNKKILLVHGWSGRGTHW
jgi:hypothetical protein